MKGGDGMLIKDAGVVALLLAVMLCLPAGGSVAAAYGPGYVFGVVTQKFTSGHDGGEWQIAVNGSPYEVPVMFWLSVNVGDAVRYTGTDWQVVKRSARE
jgi:hypothetical protein